LMCECFVLHRGRQKQRGETGITVAGCRAFFFLGVVRGERGKGATDRKQRGLWSAPLPTPANNKRKEGQKRKRISHTPMSP